MFKLINGFRFKRDADCENPPEKLSYEMDKCCKFPVTFDAKISEKCEKDFPDEGKKDDDPTWGACSIQCIFNTTNLVNKNDGKINQDVVTKYFTANPGSDPAWQDIVKNSLTMCSDFMSKNDDNFNKIKPPPTKKVACDIKPTMYSACLFSQQLIKCPDSSFTKCKFIKIKIKLVIDLIINLQLRNAQI